MKKILSLVFVVTLLLSGCAKVPERISQETDSGMKTYTANFMTLFDTVTTIVGRDESEELFFEKARAIHDELEEYHQLFDIYNEYDNIANLKTINDHAGIEPVKVDERIIHLLQDCKEMYLATNGKVNVAMGSVLSLWHESREYGRKNPKDASLPDMSELKDASEHMDFNKVVINVEASTVYIEDPMLSLDVGAIAKGWSVQQVAQQAPEGLLISVGGNVYATGPKDQNGTPWVVGIQNPNGGKDLHTVYLTKGSMVTSGDYQRTYQVDGKMYHHLIDPNTLYPAMNWRCVTIMCSDSGIADALSTALFLMSKEDGQKLLEQYQAEAMWVDHNGDISYSPGFKKQIRT